MYSNPKLLVFATAFLIIAGFGFLWFGFNPAFDPLSPAPTTTPKVEHNPTISDNIIVATRSAVVGIEGERVLVANVIDGDTLELQSGEKVRLIGIDTPETKDPRKPVGCFGKEASNETKKLIEGKEVILQKDISETDKYKRLLRYVFLPLEDGRILFVQDYLVREGFAKVLTFPPDIRFNEQLREAEAYAKINKKGLWGRC